MSGVIGASTTAVVMTNTIGSTSVTIASGVTIAGSGTYGVGLYSQYILSPDNTQGPKARVVSRTLTPTAVFSENIVNNGNIYSGATSSGIVLVQGGTHSWRPAYTVPDSPNPDYRKYSYVTASSTITNSGTIKGGGFGIDIGFSNPTTDPARGSSILINNPGALIEGGIATNLVVEGGLAAVDIGRNGYNASIVNAGTIIGLAGYGEAVAFGGSLTNLSTGTISAAHGAAILSQSYPSYVYNAGHVGGNIGLYGGGTIINHVGATITNGVNDRQGSLTVNNAGYIGSQNIGVNANSLSLVNTGAILASGNNGGFAVVANLNSTINNLGSMGGTGFHEGVYIGNAGTSTLVNAAHATINGNAEYGLEVSGNNAASINNAGLLWGTVRFNGGTASSTLINSGTIVASYYAGGAQTPLNGEALQLKGSGTTTILNQSGGIITSGTANGGADYGIGVDGVHHALITNDGLIAGDVVFNAGTVSSTLVNAGVIGTSASSYAVSFAAGSQDRLIVDPGSTFIGTIDGGNTLGSTAISTLEFGAGGGTLAGFGTSVFDFGQISIDPGASWQLVGSAAAFQGETITGLGTATAIELAGTVEHFSSFTANNLALDGGTTLTILGSYAPGQISVTNDGTNTFITACFATGTRIATSHGAVAVEALREGDLVVTASGRLAPVRWLGHRHTRLARHPNPHDVMPVRIRAGALSEGAPSHDLVLSPDHAVLIDGRLVPARHLVNGVSVVQETREAVTYWHVELDRHDVIIAEGMACESYLDTGNRAAFENADGPAELHPDFARRVWAAEGCAPILTDPAQATLRALHTRLLARAHSGAAQLGGAGPRNATRIASRTA